MKTMTKSTALAVATAFLAMPVAASADTTPGWYAGLGAGANFMDNSKVDSHRGPAYFDYGTDYDVLANGGYAWGNGWRTEGEVFHSSSIVDNKDGALNNTDVFANAFYDFDMGWMLTPYLGAGIGLGYADADNIGPVAGGAHLKDYNINLAYQGIAGVSAQLDKQWSVTADYRYIAAMDSKFKDTAGFHDRLDNNVSNNVIIGVRYNFEPPAPMPVAMKTTAPVPQQRMATPPMVAPVPHSFEVFFDFNKSVLTPEAKRIIASAAQEYKQGGYVRVVVTGHTDTVGTSKYNEKLSKARAAAVKAEFVKLGIDASTVSAKGVGKDGLLVPTNDQVREAQNRRAEIVLDKQ